MPWKHTIKANFRKRYSDKQQVKNHDVIAKILASTMINAYTYWMEHPDAIGTSEMKNAHKETP